MEPLEMFSTFIRTGKKSRLGGPEPVLRDVLRNIHSTWWLGRTFYFSFFLNQVTGILFGQACWKEELHPMSWRGRCQSSTNHFYLLPQTLHSCSSCCLLFAYTVASFCSGVDWVFCYQASNSSSSASWAQQRSLAEVMPGLRSWEPGEPLWQLGWESQKKLPLPAGQLLSSKSSWGLPCAVCEQTAPTCCVSGWDAVWFVFRKLPENA